MYPRIGILGGGQLGRMLCQAGSKLGMSLMCLDKDNSYPAAHVCSGFEIGDFTDYDSVCDFGRQCDIITIEIEKVNVDALEYLASIGKGVFPSPSTIRLIQDKGAQKAFLEAHDIPTAPFKTYESIEALRSDVSAGRRSFPFVQKLRREGYDGRGVMIIRGPEELEQAFRENFLVEEKVDIHREVAIIICRNTLGQTVLYDPVEMVFDAEANVLMYQLCPAEITGEQHSRIQSIAKNLAEAFDLVGLLAIELFIDRDGQILVNEMAPRPHNSGHHTIEGTRCSQFENHLRAIQGLPLGSAQRTSMSLMANILGAEGFTGIPKLEGLQHVLSEENVFLHLYGKQTTRPFRKMGHLTIVGEERNNLVARYNTLQSKIKMRT